MRKVKRGGVVIVGLLLRAGVGVWGEKDWASLDFWWVLVWEKMLEYLMRVVVGGPR